MGWEIGNFRLDDVKSLRTMLQIEEHAMKEGWRAGKDITDYTFFGMP